MTTGCYLVNKGRTDASAEARALAEVFGSDIDIDIVFFEDVVVTAETGEDDTVLMTDGSRRRRPDFAFVRAFGLSQQERYHLLAVLRMLEGKGTLCINGAMCKETTVDKLLSYQVAKAVAPEVLLPRTMLVTPGVSARTIVDYIGLPVVIKVLRGEGGRGVTMVDSERALDSLLEVVSAAPFGDQIIAQQPIMTSKGRDLRVMVSGGRAVGALMRVNDSGFKSNVHMGGHVERFDTPQAVLDTATRIAGAVGLQFGSVDFLFGDEGEFYLLEINSSVGLVTEVFESSGIDVSDLVDDVRRALEGRE